MKLLFLLHTAIASTTIDVDGPVELTVLEKFFRFKAATNDILSGFALSFEEDVNLFTGFKELYRIQADYETDQLTEDSMNIQIRMVCVLMGLSALSP